MFGMDSMETLIILFVAVILLWILREVFCWYYKINQRVELMEEQRDLLKKLVDKKDKE